MFRLVLSTLLIIAFIGASAASLMHGLNHGSDGPGHHAEISENGGLVDTDLAFADCCDSTGGMGSASCFGELLATAAISPIDPAATNIGAIAHAGSGVPDHTLIVPTGPPKA